MINLELPLPTKDQLSFSSKRVDVMGDLFLENQFKIDEVIAFIGNVYCLLDEPPIFYIKTKQAEAMLIYFNDSETVYRVNECMKRMGWDLPEENSLPKWILPNLFLGVEISNQEEADLLIPLLLKLDCQKWICVNNIEYKIDLMSVAKTNFGETDVLRGWRKFLRAMIKVGHIHYVQVINTNKNKIGHINFIKHQCESVDTKFEMKNE